MFTHNNGLNNNKSIYDSFMFNPSILAGGFLSFVWGLKLLFIYILHIYYYTFIFY